MSTTIEKIKNKDLTLDLIKNLYHHQMYENTYKNSLFKKIFSSCCELKTLTPLKNHTLYLLKQDNDLIGLSMVKTFQTENIPLFKLKDSFRSNSKIGAIYNKEFFLQDWFQIYIKPEFRNKKFATQLLHFVEEDLIQSYQLKDNQIPLLVGKGLAFNLIEKKSKHFFPIKQDKIYSNKVNDLSHITEKIIHYIFEPENKQFPFSYIKRNIEIIQKEDQKNILKNKILGIKKP